MLRPALLLAGAIVIGMAATHRPGPAPQCPAPRPSSWQAIRDTAWPLIAHREGDEGWAHFEPAGLPGASATWCNPLAADVQAVSAGRDLYREACSACHGEDGRGDGPGAGIADPAPYDFTRPEFAGLREPPGPGILYAILARGIDGTAMMGHGEALSGWERLAVIAYITRFPGDSALAASRAWADTLRARRP